MKANLYAMLAEKINKMNRKEFLTTVWRKYLKPILLLVAIFFCVRFLGNVLIENGSERHVTVAIIAFGLFMLATYLVAELFTSFIAKMRSILPEKVNSSVRIISKLLNYVYPILMGMLIYHFWLEGLIVAMLPLIILLIHRAAEILKKKSIRLTNES